MASLFSVDSYVGVDACEELLDVARCDNPNYFFKKGDVCDFEAEGEFDVVMFIAVLQHLAKDEDWLKALGNARKILKDSGKVIVSIWDFDGCEDGDMWLSFDHVGKRFYRAMPDEKFVELCESAGLNIVERKNGRNRIYILEN
jgi:2-polyprenyl-3-methyl-5-hydroxy-6-metoxy-1,4-benzoquinol methylase